MAIHYCKHCGGKSEGYKLNFCGSCGKPFVAQATITQPKPAPPAPPTKKPSKPQTSNSNAIYLAAKLQPLQQPVDDDYDDGDDYIPDIKSLSFKVEAHRPDRAISFKELAEMPAVPKEQRTERPLAPTMTKEETIEWMRKEGGNSGINHEID